MKFLVTMHSSPHVCPSPRPWTQLSHNQWQMQRWFSVSWSQKGTAMEVEESASFLPLDRQSLGWLAKIRSSPGTLLTALGKIPRDRFQPTLVQPTHHSCESSYERLKMWAKHPELLSPSVFPEMFVLRNLLKMSGSTCFCVKVNMRFQINAWWNCDSFIEPSDNCAELEGGDFIGDCGRRGKIWWKKVWFWISLTLCLQHVCAETLRTVNPH